MTESLMSTYKRLPVTFAHGAGARLWDDSGNEFLDALSGIAVCNLGHAHPALTDAICDQAGRLLHTSNVYGIRLQEQLGDVLTRLAGMDRAFFANSGAEANEAAIKLARLHGHRQGIKAPAIVVMQNAFHGRTLATLTASGSRKVQAGFEPLVQGFIRTPYGDIEALKAIAANRSDIVAVMLEPIQGEGGVQLPPNGYLAAVRELCDDSGWLMIADEIQTGMARTGRMFACMHEDTLPDVMTLAKALGNGVPIGACLARGAAAELFAPGNHGSTFGGNPLACAAALAVCRVIEQEQLAARAATLGQRLLDGLRTALDGETGVVEIRGRGMMIGIELDRPCAELVSLALDSGVLINVTADTVVRLLPPLVMETDQAEHLIATLSRLIKDFTNRARA